MGMAEDGVACKCMGRRSLNILREVCFDKRKFMKNLTNVYSIPHFKWDLSRRRSVFGKILRFGEGLEMVLQTQICTIVCNKNSIQICLPLQRLVHFMHYLSTCHFSIMHETLLEFYELATKLMGLFIYFCCMDAQERSRSRLLVSSKHKKVPIFVMVPIDLFGIDTSGAAKIRKIKALTISIKALKLAGVHGIAVEVWWGIVECASPFAYNWSLYEELFKLISESGLKLHVALSFHSNMHLTSGGQGGVSLPLWVLEIGRHNKDIYYQDWNGVSNDDYLTLGVDQHPLFCGRTALQCYEDFMLSFVNKFEALLGTVIEEISVGLGPCGELRWRFPGIGEFQCYDKYMMEDLKTAAYEEGKPQWGNKGPRSAGRYNSFPSGVPFFKEGQESFLSDYGHFFLEWYSRKLTCHADSILSKAAKMFEKYQENEQNSILLVAKIGIIYWWYQTVSHPAELTAGYYNTAIRDGYDPLALMLSRHRAALQISCFEMMDIETPQTYLCSPEGLLQQIRDVSKKRIMHLTGRNSYERFDKVALQQIYTNCYFPQEESVRSFTYFRMNDKIFRVDNWNNFVPFVRKMSTYP